MAADRRVAELVGEEQARARDLELPVDPRAVAEDVDVLVVEKPTKGGVSGMLMRMGESYVIAYAAHLPNEGFQRFSIAHELGHYFLPGHLDHVFDANGVHVSRGAFRSKAPHEVEADAFAVGLLMPRKQFLGAMSAVGDGLAAIEALAARCCTSVTATAIRFAQLCRDPVAVVVSGQESVEYCFMSDAFASIRDLTWLLKDEQIPRRSATYRFVGDPSRIVQGDREEDTTPLRDWFGSGPDVQLTEQVLGLGRYGRVLTVLTPEDAVDDDEQEEDEAMVASWTPTFSKSRRR